MQAVAPDDHKKKELCEKVVFLSDQSVNLAIHTINKKSCKEWVSFLPGKVVFVVTAKVPCC